MNRWESVPRSDEGRGLERAGAWGGGGEDWGDEERVVAAADSVKTPSSGGRDSVSSDCQPKRALPQRLKASSVRASQSDTSEPMPDVVTESERAYVQSCGLRRLWTARGDDGVGGKSISSDRVEEASLGA